MSENFLRNLKKSLDRFGEQERTIEFGVPIVCDTTLAAGRKQPTSLGQQSLAFAEEGACVCSVDSCSGLNRV